MKGKKEFFTNIVQTWNINRKPEFRGFRCGVCQTYITKAYHHVLDSKKYLVTVHVCDNCQKENNVEGGLPTGEAGEYKAFSCDQCGTEVTEAWHIWNKEKERLVERHLCKSCGTEKGYD